MPHELTVKNGEAEMFYYGETPWHGLGTPVDHALTAFEAIEAAKLNWTVRKETAYRALADGTFVESPAFLTVREDNNTVLGVVKKDYRIIQNHDAFSFLDSLVMSAEAKYHTAGSLRGGKRVWMLAKLPDAIRVKGDDVVDKYLLLLNGHDGRMALRVMFTPVRVVCMNTLMMALRQAQVSVYIPHQEGLEKKIEKARNVLGLAVEYFQTQEEIFKAFASKEMLENDLDKYYEAILPADESLHNKGVQEFLKRLHEEGAGAEMARGTLWGAYNSVIEYVDHHRTSFEANPEQYLGGIIFGAGMTLKTKAYNVAAEMVR